MCQCTQLGCRLCLDALCRQSKGSFGAHVLLRELNDSIFDSVKADSLFSYQPPVNLFALWILLPASYILTPRWFHKVWFSIYVYCKFN